MKLEFFIAERYLKAKRKGLFAVITTAIGVAGVAVGVAALVTTLSVMNGFQEDIQNKIIGAQAHIVIYGHMSAQGSKTLEDKLKAMPDVAATAPMVYGQAIITKNERSLGILVRGLDPGAEKTVNSLDASLTQGGWSTKKRPGELKPPPGIVLGEELAKNISVWLGDDVLLVSPKSMATDFGIFPKMKKFRVSGLIKTGYYEFDNSMGYMAIDQASDFFNLHGAVTGLEVKLKNIGRTAETAAIIAGKMGFPYSVKTFAQMNQTLYAALKLEKFVMFVILALIVLVAALNIASNLILLSTEKLRDIGVLRSLGASAASIRKIFLYEGLLIGTIGILLGILLGFGLCWFIARYPVVELPGDIYYITRVPVSVKWRDIASIIAGSYLLCFAATVYPAVRASKISPVEAIRYG